MPANAAATLNYRDFFTLAPEIVLVVWGMVVLLYDLIPLRGRPVDERRRLVTRLALVGAALTFTVTILALCVRFDLYGLQGYLNFAKIDYQSEPDAVIFQGTLSADLLTDVVNFVFAGLLVLVVWMSDTWSFTDDWGEYYALLLWSTVGMMLLSASEELLTLFLTLETMTICLYLMTAFEKNKRRSAEGGLKYFVYGSVSSALFLFGLSLIYGLTGSTQFFAIRTGLNPSIGGTSGLAGNVAGAAAVLLMMVGFGFKIAAVPFHQWAPDAYEGAPAPVTAWVATGSKIASFVALMKVLLHALGPWASSWESVTTPGWIGLVAVLSAASMTYGNFAALAQKNFKRMLAYSSIAHAGYMLVGVAAAGISPHHADAAGSVLFYLLIYAFSNLGAFALAAWLFRDKESDLITDLNGLGLKYPGVGLCMLLLMLSLIGMPPLAGFFGKLYMFMEALDESSPGRITMMWLVALGLLNSVVSAFYYVRVLQAMFLRDPAGGEVRAAPSSVVVAIGLGTAVTLGFGVYPTPLLNVMKSAAVPMLAASGLIGSRGVSRITLPVGPPTPRAPGKPNLQGVSLGGAPPTPPPPQSPPAQQEKKRSSRGKTAAPPRGKGQQKSEPKGKASSKADLAPKK
jgi:NADH-quinone oxidoreductase subunit N